MKKTSKITTYSPKQLELMQLWRRGGLRRINLLEGSVRSGKTWISLVLWAFWVATMPPDGQYLMAAKTLSTLRRNCLNLLQSLVGTDNFEYSISKKEARLFGRLVYLEGANDAASEGKIRGMTLHGAYCDELTLTEQDFFSMLLSRLSVPNAKLFATTNPDSPSHWLMTQYISRADELDMLAVKFLLEDNITLDTAYVENLKREYIGMFYQRYILGLWTAAQGVVYPMFDEARHVVDYDDPRDGLYYISVDYGTANPCSMGLWRLENDCAVRMRAVRVGEYYHDSKKTQKQLTDEQYYQKLCELADGRNIQYIVVDPSAASFIAAIRHHGQYAVKKAKNDVIGGIRKVSSMLENDALLFDRSCIDTIREFASYCWDEGSGEDKVIKQFDHAMDDMRYFCNTVAARMFS